MDRSLMEGDAIRQGKFNPYSTEKDSPEATNAPAFRPFAGLRPTRDRIHTGPSLKDVELAEGDRIRHTKFGQGVIATLEGNVVTVDFDSGERKKLALDIAPLEKV
jgi:DNA helicase-2/ATP-dependent DNA helicase PcrA